MTLSPDLRHLIALAQIPGVGAQAFKTLLEAFPDPEVLFEQPLPASYRRGLSERTRQALRQPDWDLVDRTLTWAAKPDRHLLAVTDPGYPPQLKEISSPPPLLYVHGQLECLRRPQLAVVGSRNPSRNGRQIAFEFARALAELNLVITSGLALGIDGAAHQGALAGGESTAAVVGTGPDRIYPARHKNLAAEIVTHGAIVSEFPPGTPVRAQHFPRRNRIIAGLSLGTLVVEATRRSGSLITARFALEQGREVMAIPGDIHNPQAKGCNALIREGAQLVEAVDDILEALNLLAPPANEPDTPTPSSTSPNPSNELSGDYRDLLNKIDYAPTPVDQLVETTGMPPAEVASMLLVLELEGYITAAPGGCYQRIR
ncbi:MAG: DNA-processing protein DprA [Methylohalobius sp. ZOD2]|nr:DNA-processing protein DprA [Methylothermaceae bacterium]